MGFYRFHQRSAISLPASTLEVSRKDQPEQGWGEIATIAKALYAEAEITVSKLRAITMTTPRCRLSLNQLTVCDDTSLGVRFIPPVTLASWTRTRLHRKAPTLRLASTFLHIPLPLS
jgi:hypothetical protein